MLGQVNSPETPEITEMTENFTKATKYLTKLRETLMSFAWEKSHVKKQLEINFLLIQGFQIFYMGKPFCTLLR